MNLVSNYQRTNLTRLAVCAVAVLISFHGIAFGQIVTIGDLNQTYNGTDDPWELGSELLIVGETAEGILLIFGGSVVNDSQATLGQNAGVVGEATVSGAGSQWNHAGGTFTVGSNGEAILNIDMGGRITGFRTQVGRNTNGQGTVTLTNGAEWIHTEDLRLASSTNSMATLLSLIHI